MSCKNAWKQHDFMQKDHITMELSSKNDKPCMAGEMGKVNFNQPYLHRISSSSSSSSWNRLSYFTIYRQIKGTECKHHLLSVDSFLAVFVPLECVAPNGNSDNTHPHKIDFLIWKFGIFSGIFMCLLSGWIFVNGDMPKGYKLSVWKKMCVREREKSERKKGVSIR